MSYTITRTKVLRPRRARDTLSRPRLLGMLDDLLEYRLALVSAPAGFGKTTLLVDFAEAAAYPVCWLSLDPLDNDPLRFLSHLIAAIQEHFPSFGGPSRSLISNQAGAEINQDRVLRTLINDLYDHIEEHFTLVLDDFHLVEGNPWVSSFVNQFAQDVDENCHLVIASRSLLSLPDLPLMIGRSQVKGLSFEELAFEPAEIQALYQTKYRQALSQREADAIARETEGWITGLLLTAETAQAGVTGQDGAARAAGVDLYDYLASQVLDQQSPQMQSFLLHTSLLEEFDLDLCQQIMGKAPEENSCKSLIGELLQKNLFIQPVEDGGTWLRYHHLFGDFLRQRCLETDPAGSRELLGKLVEVYSQRGWWEKAYAACQLLGDERITGDFLESASSSLLHRGQYSLLFSWLSDLGQSLIETRPTLLICYVTISITRNEYETGLRLINQALENQIYGEDRCLKAQMMTRQSTCYRMLGNYSQGLAAATRALELAAGEDQGQILSAEAEREIGLNHRRLGNSLEAKDHLDASRKIYLAQRDQKNAAIVEMDLGSLAMSTGSYSEARGYYQQAYTIWEGLENYNRLVGLCNNLGVLDHLIGDMVEAFNWFNKGLEYARQTSNTRGAAFTLTSLAELARDLGALPAADRYLDQAEEQALQSKETFLQSYLQILRAGLARLAGDLEEAKSHLDAARTITQENPSGIEAGYYHFERGRIWLAENHVELAEGDFRSAGKIFSQANTPVEWASALIFQARSRQLLADPVKAWELLDKAGEILQGLGTHNPLVPLLAAEQELLAEQADLFPLDSYLQALMRAVVDFLAGLPEIQAALGFQDTPGLALLEPTLDIQALGHELVRLEGRAISAPEWTKQKTVRELFFYLLRQPEGATREEICKVFWPDSSPGQLKKQFKNAIYRLRRSVGRDVILYHQPTRLYHFNRALDYRYDVEDYRQAAAWAENETDPERKIHRLRRVLDLYRHPFAPTLEGIWAEPERFRLYTLYENSSLALAELLLERGDLRGALDASTRLLEISPGQEAACRLAMRALAARGDRSGVERVFQACRQALNRQLDATPSPETASLYQKLID